MEKGEKDEEIRYVQPIPFGVMIRAANIRIDNEGRIWIGKRRKQCLKDIHSAIRQQLYILSHYKGILLNLTHYYHNIFSLSHSGMIENIAIIIREISEIQGMIEDMQKTKNVILKQKINDFLVSAIELEAAIEKERNRISQIEKGVLNRLNHLKQEQKRCEKIIVFNVKNWFYIYKILTETPKEKWRIKWSDFFYGLRSIKTLVANPYRERVFSKEIQRLSGTPEAPGVFRLIKQEKKYSLARKVLWRAILKLLPLYPEEMRWVVGGNTFVIREGKIKEVIYGSTIH